MRSGALRSPSRLHKPSGRRRRSGAPLPAAQIFFCKIFQSDSGDVKMFRPDNKALNLRRPARAFGAAPAPFVLFRAPGAGMLRLRLRVCLPSRLREPAAFKGPRHRPRLVSLRSLRSRLRRLLAPLGTRRPSRVRPAGLLGKPELFYQKRM